MRTTQWGNRLYLLKGGLQSILAIFAMFYNLPASIGSGKLWLHGLEFVPILKIKQITTKNKQNGHFDLYTRNILIVLNKLFKVKYHCRVIVASM